MLQRVSILGMLKNNRDRHAKKLAAIDNAIAALEKAPEVHEVLTVLRDLNLILIGL